MPIEAAAARTAEVVGVGGTFGKSAAAVLAEPYSAMSAGQWLDHLGTRSGVRYFPLADGSSKQVDAAQRILDNVFDLNNEVHRLPDGFDWQRNPSRDLEWLILLHKFYFSKELAGAYDRTGDERYARKWVELVASWIAQNPDGFIDSQVTGRRVQQWLHAFQYFAVKRRSRSLDDRFVADFVCSTHSQTRYLCRNLTPEGNHRTIELYAIFLVAVLFPEFRDAEHFLQFSLRELLDNMRRDLLADGVHRELSTDYHHTVLKNYLRFCMLAELNGLELPGDCDRLLEKALEFSLYVHKPDGSIPAINDGDCNGYLPLLKKAARYYPIPGLRYVVSQGREGRAPEQRSRGFGESGYYLLRDDWRHRPYHEGLYLFFDCAGLGFGSHGHYDLMNIEMAAYGRSLIVDPGRYTYHEHGPDGVNWRKLFKGTAYHNTVAVDGKNQIPYRRGRPTDPEPTATLRHFVSCRGFDYLHGVAESRHYPVIHQRMIFFALPEYWIVGDLLTGSGMHRYDLSFHLSKEAQDGTTIDRSGDGLIVNSPNLVIAQPEFDSIDAALEPGFVSPEYGIKHAAPIVRFTQTADAAGFNSVLYPFKDLAPPLRIEQVPVLRNGRDCGRFCATALKISLGEGLEARTDFFFIAHERRADDEFECFGAALNCRLLYFRRDASKRIVNLQADAVAKLAIGGELSFLDGNGEGRIQYRDGLLEASSSAGNIVETGDCLSRLSERSGPVSGKSR